MSKFAVLVERTLTYPDTYDDYKTNTVTKYTELIEFGSEEALKNWILANDRSLAYGYHKYRAIRFDELQVTKNISISVDAT